MVTWYAKSSFAQLSINLLQSESRSRSASSSIFDIIGHSIAGGSSAHFESTLCLKKKEREKSWNEIK